MSNMLAASDIDAGAAPACSPVRSGQQRHPHPVMPGASDVVDASGGAATAAAAAVVAAAAATPAAALSRSSSSTGHVDSGTPEDDHKHAGARDAIDSVDLSTHDGSDGVMPGVSDAFDSDRSTSFEESAPHPLRRFGSRFLHVLLKSGMLSAVIFLVGMLVYNVAVPLSELGYDVCCSWLYFWGAIIFIVEAVVEMVYCVKFPPERLQKRDITSMGDRFRAVNWELWSGVFFMIPSIFYLAEALVDPTIVGPRPAQVLRSVGIDDASFISVCDWSAASLLVVDALIRYCARWCIDSELAAEDKLVRFRAWTAEGLSSFDWLFWGDIMFVVAAVLGLFIKFYPSNIALSATSSGLWTFDALLYLMAAVFEWRTCQDEDAAPEAAMV